MSTASPDRELCPFAQRPAVLRRHPCNPCPSLKQFLLLCATVCGVVGSLRAAEPVRLANAHGAEITLEDDDGWRLTTLTVPGGAADGIRIEDRSVEVGTTSASDLLAPGWTLVDATEDRVVLEQTGGNTRLQVRRILSFGPASNVLRIETWARGPSTTLTRVGLLDARVPGEWFWETGAAPASFPLFGESIFAGIEHVSGESHTTGEEVRLTHRPRMSIGENWQFVAAAVVGWPLPGADLGVPDGYRMRVAFLHYLDSIRIKPERIVLHSETWWTMMPPLWEKDVLADIDALKRGFHDRTGMFFDTYCLDLGWSDPRTFWRVAESRFPTEFRAVNERLAGLGTKLGLWMSPGSGYPEGLNNPWLQGQGYEMTPFPAPLGQVPCFALGTRYQREFKERVVGFATQYGLGHVILDFINYRCDVASHGHPVGPESRYAIDAGVADVLDSLRAVNPSIALEPMVCGYPPSPWWLMKTPFMLGPAGDDLPYGRVPCPEWMEALITARDIAYRASQESWLMPTQSLETWDLIVQTPGEFENTAVMAIGRGRWFLSSYLKPSLMKPEDWDFLAALVRWARANKENLVNAWMIGGKPEEREAYGFMFRNGAKDLFCLRNPWIEERGIELPPSPVATEARELRMVYPRRATLARLEPGAGPVRLKLAPYETVFLETVVAGGESALTPLPETPVADVVADTLEISESLPARDATETAGLTAAWFGSIGPVEAEGVELCVLVEGNPGIEHSACDIFLNGQAVRVQRATSAGQFGAASDASPDNWVWFIASLPKNTTTFEFNLRVPPGKAKLSAYLRGTVAATSAAAPEAGLVFPVFKPEQRAWSQTLLRPQELELDETR